MTWLNPPAGSRGQDLPGSYDSQDDGGEGIPDPAQRQPDERAVGQDGLSTSNIHHRHPSGLVITDIQVRPVSNDRLRAWVTMTFNDAFVIKGIRIIQGNTRLFVAMPSRQQKDGTYQDVAHPIHKAFRNYLEEKILEIYENSDLHQTDEAQ